MPISAEAADVTHGLKRSPLLHPEQIQAYRSMTPEQKLRAASDLYWAARRLKEAAVRQQHPEWSDERVASAVREIFQRARD